WFVGFTDRYTAAVWVGYPDKLQYMRTEYHGQPVEGGTYPADIWHDLMTSVIAIDQARHPNQKDNTTTDQSAPPSYSPAPSAPPSGGGGQGAPSQTPQAPQNGNGGGGHKVPQQPPQQAPPAQPPQQPPQGGT